MPARSQARSQAAWSIEGNEDYIVAGGEFPRAGDLQQQGLVRYTREGTESSSATPEIDEADIAPTLRSTGAGEVLVSWHPTWDRDNAALTYEVVRNGQLNNPIHSRVVNATDWDRPYQSYLDTGLTPGASVDYRIVARDAHGNVTRSRTESVVVAGSGAIHDYARAVTRSGPKHYWQLDEPSGATAADYTNLDDATLSGGFTRGTAGPFPGTNATTFNGQRRHDRGQRHPRHGPFWYSVEAWFNTTSNQGGRIVGFGEYATGTSRSPGPTGTSTSTAGPDQLRIQADHQPACSPAPGDSTTATGTTWSGSSPTRA